VSEEYLPTYLNEIAAEVCACTSKVPIYSPHPKGDLP
jgi:hypothetical protein